MASESKEEEIRGVVKGPDMSATVDEALPSAIAAAKAGDLNGAVEKLLVLEKKMRLGGDTPSTSRVALQILKLCFEAGDLKALNANIMVLSKRRGQIKSVLTDMVREAMTYTDKVPSKEDRVELITTLRTVSEGKIHVEVERARLTKQLAELREAEGKVAEASEILQEVAVETFGSMDRREKAEFLLEQVRLTLVQRDYVKMGILANKINKRQLDEEGMEDIRLRFYTLLTQLHQFRHDAMALCKDYQAIVATRGYADDASKWVPPMQSVIVYLALAPFDNEASDMMHKLKADKRLEDPALAPHKALLELLTTHEVAPWPLPEPHHAAIVAHDAFTKEHPGPLPAPSSAAGTAAAAGGGAGAAAGRAGRGMDVDGSAGASASSAAGRSGIATSIVRKEDEERAPWLPVLQKRVVQHNVRVAAKWYTRLSSARLAALLGLDADTTELVVSELAADKAIYAKFDRPAGIVVFQRPRPAEEVLSDWASDIDTVLGLVETTQHLIQKEYLVRGIGGAPAAAAR